MQRARAGEREDKPTLRCRLPSKKQSLDMNATVIGSLLGSCGGKSMHCNCVYQTLLFVYNSLTLVAQRER